MKNKAHGFSTEVRVPLQPVLVFLIIAACLLLVTASDVVAERTISMVFSGVLGMLSFWLWGLEHDHPLLARWLTLFLVLGSIVLYATWQRVPELLFLFAIPCALAAALINVRACVFFTIGLSLVVTGLFAIANHTGWSIPAHVAFTVVVLLWGMVGVLLAIYLPIEKLALWTWQYYSEAQISVEQARDSKVELSQAVESLEYANRQLALVNERATALRWVAEEAQEAKSAFVARVSHEFRTPLNIIIGMVNLLVENPEVYETPPSGKALEHLKVVYRNCQHLASMINDVLALSQAQAGRMVLHRTYVQLDEIISAAREIVQPLITEKALMFYSEVPADLPPVYCDQTRIRQILLNLLSNAARLTEKGHISIAVEATSHQVTIIVSDTGPGIAPEEMEHIFEPFFQGNVGSWRDNRGTGLGLSISRQFVALHGGRMWVESELGKGSTFYIQLPVEPIPELATTPTRWIREDWEWRDRQNRPSFPDTHYRPRILVWHENETLSTLHDWTSDTVEWVHVTREDMTATEVMGGTYRALLVNVEDPETIWKATQDAVGKFPDIPVLGCCYKNPPNPLIDAGASAYLTKPLTHTQLERALSGIQRPIKHALVLDDDADSRELLETYLHIVDSDAKVTCVGTGNEAYTVLRREKIDLLLLDLLLRDENGFDILSEMQVQSDYQDIPVIMVTAQDSSPRSAYSPLLLVTAREGLDFGKLVDGVNFLADLMLR